MGKQGKKQNANIAAMLALRPIPACWIGSQGEIIDVNKDMKRLMAQLAVARPNKLLNLLQHADVMLLLSYIQKPTNTKHKTSLRFVIERVSLVAGETQFRCEIQHINIDENSNDWLLWLEPIESLVVLSTNQHGLDYDVQMKSAIMDASLDTLVTIDLNDIIVEFSKAGEETFGWSRQEVLGKRMVDILVPAEHREAHMRGMKHYQATLEGPLIGKRVEIEAQHKDGSTIPIELALVPLKVNNEVYVTAFIRDISKRKIVEQELREQKHRAEQASVAKSRFLSHMSHELRSPLNSLLGTLDVLGQTDLNKLNRYYLQIARSSGDLLLSVINDILDFSKIESGSVELVPTQLNLKKLINHTLTVAQARCSEHVLLSGYIDPALADKIITDEVKIRQIMLILVDNALKFTPKGAVNVVIRATRIAGCEADKLHLQVSDTGVGIEEEMQQAIFAEFEQVDAMRDTRYGGTGLGLAIARKLVDLMDGEMTLNSELGKGTTFNVYLPMIEKTIPVVKRQLPQPLILFSGNPHFIRLLHQVMEREFSNPLIIDIDREEALLSLLEGATNEHIVLSDHITDILLVHRLAKLPKVKRVVVATRLPMPNEGEFSPSCSFLSAPLLVHELIDIINGKKANSILNSTEPSANNDQQLSLLLVEDQLSNRVVARALLEKQGYLITDVEDGIQALEHLDTNKEHDVILMDMRMPRLNGIDTAKRIRCRADHYANIPIIALTANAEQSEVQRCFDAGFDAFVTKPFNAKELTRIIEKLTQDTQDSNLSNKESD